MAIEITNDDVIKALRKAVELKGKDYVYVNKHGEKATGDGIVQCHYVHGDECGCIVGTVLHSLGVSLYEMSKHEGENAEELIRLLEEKGVLTVADESSKILGTAQLFQDVGETWRVALEKAEAIYSNL